MTLKNVKPHIIIFPEIMDLKFLLMVKKFFSSRAFLPKQHAQIGQIEVAIKH